MTNGNKLNFAIMGSLAGAMFSLSSLVAFIPLNIHPVVWLAFMIFVCMPAGAAIGWRYAEKFDRWERRQ